MLSGISVPGYSGKSVKIPKQNAQRVSNPPIGVAETREHFLGKRHVVRVIDAARPKPNEIGAVLTDEMTGGCRLVVRAGF